MAAGESASFSSAKITRATRATCRNIFCFLLSDLFFELDKGTGKRGQSGVKTLPSTIRFRSLLGVGMQKKVITVKKKKKYRLELTVRWKLRAR